MPTSFCSFFKYFYSRDTSHAFGSHYPNTENHYRYFSKVLLRSETVIIVWQIEWHSLTFMFILYNKQYNTPFSGITEPLRCSEVIELDDDFRLKSFCFSLSWPFVCLFRGDRGFVFLPSEPSKSESKSSRALEETNTTMWVYWERRASINLNVIYNRDERVCLKSCYMQMTIHYEHVYWWRKIAIYLQQDRWPFSLHLLP